MKSLLLSLIILASCRTSGDVDFAGTDDSADRTLFLSATENFTMMCWFRPGTQSENGVIIYNGASGSNGYGMMVSDGSCGIGNSFVIQVGGITCSATGSGVPLTSGTWYHLAVTRSTSTWRVYVNGVQTSTVTGSAIPTTPSGQFHVGGDGTNSNAIGRIANVVTYSRELSANEILTLATCRQFRVHGSNVTIWYPLEALEGTSVSGSSLVDRSGFNLPLTGSAGPNATGVTGRGSESLSYP